MRKTSRNAVGAMLGTVLVSATMAVAAPSAYAADCDDATPLGVDARTGTVEGATSLWWSFVVDADDRVVSLTTAAGSARLEVRDASCSTVLCTDTSSPAQAATCTLDNAGTVTVGVVGEAGDILSDLPRTTEFVLDVFNHVAGCSDGADNDADGLTDWPNDPECKSKYDNTEEQARVAAYGTITIETNANDVPKMTLTGVFALPNRFTCFLETSTIQATCVQVRDSEFLFTCQHFVLTAKAFSTSKPTGKGSAKGAVTCDSGAVLETEEVDSYESIVKTMSTANNYRPPVQLGTAGVVRCRAAGIKGATNAKGAYTVTCDEPGVEWPYGNDPRG